MQLANLSMTLVIEYYDIVFSSVRPISDIY